MCDTFGIIKSKRCFFGKNSDRSPNESQIIQYIPSKTHKNNKIKLTYIEIEQVKNTNAILISRPSWLWGAEMGVNEFGVCIGNEAIFTTRKKRKKGLIGMDIVRLALERSKSAAEAIQVITDLIDRYGQDGNCGYDHSFLYDNSFLIMDFNSIYILETSGKNHIVSEKFDKNCISNNFILKNDNKFFKTNFIMTYFSGANKRRSLVLEGLHNVTSVLDCFKILRTHSNNNEKKGSVSSPCMHSGGLIGDHTTSSMVVELNKENKKIEIWFTGSSTPCQSIFKKYTFGDLIQYPICNEIIDDNYWIKREKFFRSNIEFKFDNDFILKRNKLEKYFLDNNITLEDALEKEEKFYESIKLIKSNIGLYGRKYWKKKNSILFKGSDL